MKPPSLPSCCCLPPPHPPQHLPFQGPGCRLPNSSNQAQNSFLLQMAGTLGLASLHPLPILAASRQHRDAASCEKSGSEHQTHCPSQQSWHFKCPFPLDWPFITPTFFCLMGGRKQIKLVISSLKNQSRIRWANLGQTDSSRATQAFPPLARQETLDCLHR